MPKAISSIAVISVLIGLCLAPVRAQTPGEREIDAIRQDVSRLYSADRKVSVKMRSGVKIVGYIDKVGHDTFTLRPLNGNKTELRYEQVESISQKSGLTKNQKTALVIGAAAAVVVVAAVFGRKKRRGGFNPPCLLC